MKAPKTIFVTFEKESSGETLTLADEKLFAVVDSDGSKQTIHEYEHVGSFIARKIVETGGPR